MTEQEMMEQIKILRTYKRAALAAVEVYASCITPDLKKFIKGFAAQIPSKNKDIPWYPGYAFSARFEEISNEFGWLNEELEKAYQAEKMKRTSEIKEEEQASEMDLKEDVEIKPEEKQETAPKKKNIEIKEGQMSLSIRGGKREGAGRKAIGIKKSVSIALPAEKWKEIDVLIQSNQFSSVSDYFRQLAMGGDDG